MRSRVHVVSQHKQTEAADLYARSLQFKDKARQKQRQQTLKQLSAQKPQQGSKAHKRGDSRAPLAQQAVIKKLPAAKRRLLEMQQDEASLVEDYRQLKKLKNGHISEVRYEMIRKHTCMACYIGRN